jgi:chloramphenicol 3-O phosphotransferase
MTTAGQIIVLNGAPRSGKSSIAAVVVQTFDGEWENVGVDSFERVTPPRLRPGIGLRPGGERPDIEAVLPLLFGMLYESVVARSKRGVNVVVDVVVARELRGDRGVALLVGDERREDLLECLVAGLPALHVGVRCPIEVIMKRRDAQPVGYETTAADGAVPDPVLLWQEEVHRPGIYDLEVDTSALSPAEAAARIRDHLDHGPPPNAFRRLAEL